MITKSKKIIFIGGTSYSGSTFFHMMLANDPRGFACGEIRWLFQPHTTYHVEHVNNSDRALQEVWRKLLESGQENVYEAIFELFPEVEFIVDSSKDPFWIEYQIRNLHRKGLQTENILIWKAPFEFGESWRKRGRSGDWINQWTNYHQLYLSLVDKFCTVKYRELAQHPDKILKACSRLGIPYFEGKEQYWTKRHYAFGGNHSARIHLYERDVAAKGGADQGIEYAKRDLHREIYYEEPSNTESIGSRTNKTDRASRLIADITQLLETRNLTGGHLSRTDFRGVHLSGYAVALKKVKHELAAQIGKFRYDHKFDL